jgi:hypothetical protein
MENESGQITPPELSVILVTADRFQSLRRTVRHLRAQTIHDRLELIIVAPTEDALNDQYPHEMACFSQVKIIPVGVIEDLDKAAAHGILKASAPVIALIEDHAYPEPQWAEVLLKAHQGPWAAVGSTVCNANPQSWLSWTNLLIAYGHWVAPVERGPTREVSRHNVSFKKQVLEPYGAELRRFLGRAGGLLSDLVLQGHTFFLEPEARIHHVNPSRLFSTIQLRFQAGRLYGAMRAVRGGWSLSKRLLYILGGPLIPLVRLYRIHGELFRNGRCRVLIPRIYPALLFGLILDGAGQMCGYAFGVGKTEQRLAQFEVDRLRHLKPSEQRILQE